MVLGRILFGNELQPSDRTLNYLKILFFFSSPSMHIKQTTFFLFLSFFFMLFVCRKAVPGAFHLKYFTQNKNMFIFSLSMSEVFPSDPENKM